MNGERDGIKDDSPALAAALGSLWKRRVAMVCIAAACVGGTALYTFFAAEKRYRATVSIQTAEAGGPSLDALSPFLQTMPIAGFAPNLTSGGSRKIAAVLGSRQLAHAVARKLRLAAWILEPERRKRGADSAEEMRDPEKAALTLAHGHPQILDGRREDAPDDGILSMSDEALRRRMAEALGLTALPDAPGEEYPLRAIRAAWYRTALEAAAKAREGAVVQTDKNGITYIRVEIPRSADLAAETANAFAAELERYFQETALTESSRHRSFIETRRNDVRERLRQAENDLAQYKRDRGIVALPNQVAAAVARSAEILALLESVKIERERLKAAKAAGGNPLLNAVERQIEALNRSLSEIDAGDGSLGFGPIDQLPDVQLTYARLTRELKLQETLYLLLEQQHEIARADEMREQVVFQVLDRAEPPTRASSPRLLVNLLAGLLAGTALSLLWALAAEMFAPSPKPKSPPPERSEEAPEAS